MTQPNQTWDRTLIIGGSGGQRTGKYSVPAPLLRILEEKGMYKATLQITDEGLLFKPYVAERTGDRQHAAVDTPKWAK